MGQVYIYLTYGVKRCDLRCASVTNMDEKTVTEQIERHMASAGITQAELGRRINPETKNPRQAVHQYLSGRRSLFTGTGKAILDALDLEVIVRPRQKQD